MSEPTEAAESGEHTGTVPELRDELRERDLPVSGTKEELVARLEADDAAAAADEQAEDAAEADAEAVEDEAAEEEDEDAMAIAEADLVTDEGEILTDSVATLTDDARAAVAEFGERLDVLAVVLTDLEARNVDPAAGALVAAAAKVRAHMDDVQRHLGPLHAGIQALANEAAVQPA